MLKENNVEIRGTVKRVWESTPEGWEWKVDFDDLIIAQKDTLRTSLKKVDRLADCRSIVVNQFLGNPYR